MAKISPTQLRAMQKLLKKGQEWECPYGLQESIATLDSLVRRGYATHHADLGAWFSPRVQNRYRITTEGAFALKLALEMETALMFGCPSYEPKED